MQLGLFLTLTVLIFFAPRSFAHQCLRCEAVPTPFIRPEPLNPIAVRENSFVLLPDGSRYELDSNFWRAVQNLVAQDENEENRNRAIQGLDLKNTISVSAKIKQLSQKHFWLDLRRHGLEMGIIGLETFVRYGPITMTLIALAEIIEHSVLPPGSPPLCLFVQTGCILGSQQLQDLWNSLRYRSPDNLPLDARMVALTKTINHSYAFWKAMKFHVHYDNQINPILTKAVYKKHLRKGGALEPILLGTPFWSALMGGPESASADSVPQLEDFLKPLDKNTPALQRFFSTQEQISFMNLQLSLARRALKPLRKKEFGLSLDLHKAVAKMGRALDQYTRIINRMAIDLSDDPATLERNARFIEGFVREFVSFHADLSFFLAQIAKGPVSIGSDLALITTPPRVLRRIQNFLAKRTSCSDRLLR